MDKNAIGIIVGSAFQLDMLRGLPTHPIDINTPFGPWTLYKVELRDRNAYISFRHGFPHFYLPNQIPYRAQTWAFHFVQVPGVTDNKLCRSSRFATLPLFQPLLLKDIMTR